MDIVDGSPLDRIVSGHSEALKTTRMRVVVCVQVCADVILDTSCSLDFNDPSDFNDLSDRPHLPDANEILLVYHFFN